MLWFVPFALIHSGITRIQRCSGEVAVRVKSNHLVSRYLLLYVSLLSLSFFYQGLIIKLTLDSYLMARCVPDEC
jgi:hypothetical protein